MSYRTWFVCLPPRKSASVDAARLSVMFLSVWADDDSRSGRERRVSSPRRERTGRREAGVAQVCVV